MMLKMLKDNFMGHPISIQSFTFPRAREWEKWACKQTSERSGARKGSKQCGASEGVSGEQANRWASGPVLQSVFLAFLNLSALGVKWGRETEHHAVWKKKNTFSLHHFQDLFSSTPYLEGSWLLNTRGNVTIWGSGRHNTFETHLF